MMEQPRLFIDHGNSRVKWGFHDGKNWLSLGSCEKNEFSALMASVRQYQPDKIIASNVAGKRAQANLELIFAEKIRFIEPVAAQCGVKNHYSEPGQLGSDRWAALIGAKKHLPEGGLVASFGTAMTADILDGEGNFLGGIIAPGLGMMKKSLSAILPLEEGQFARLPRNTQDAVHSGAVNALCGAVERLARLHRYDTCVIAGGNSAEMAPHLDLEVKIVENIVLDGLLLIAGDTP